MTDRTDPYSGIHRALRKRLFDDAIQLGQVDPFDDGAVAGLIGRFDLTIAVLRAHAAHEDTYFHPLLAGSSWAGLQALERDHAEHEIRLQRFEAALQQLRSAEASQRPTLVQGAYRNWNVFLAHYLLHLDAEERGLLEELWRRVDENRLIDAFMSMRASLKADEAFTSMQWICEASSPQQIEQMFNGLRHQMGADVFRALVDRLTSSSPRVAGIARMILDGRSLERRSIAHADSR